jgi:hypothetical protein
MNANYAKCYSATVSSLKPFHAYYDLSQKKRYHIGEFLTLKEAVHARNLFEVSLLASGNLKDALKSVAKHFEKTLWKLSPIS